MKAERLREVAGCGVACGSGSSFACEGCIWVCLLRLVLGCLCGGGGEALVRFVCLQTVRKDVAFKSSLGLCV